MATVVLYGGCGGRLRLLYMMVLVVDGSCGCV